MWGTSPRGNIGANFSRYTNPSFDALVDSAVRTFRPAERRALFSRAWQVVIDDAAAIWMYEPRNVAAVSNRVTPVGLRGDAWWASLAQWRVTSPPSP